MKKERSCPSMVVSAGQKLGNYRLIRSIGRGGFAEVYLGEHIYLKTPAAIKVLETRLIQDGLENFLKEASTIASLEHPNIVRVLEFGIEDTIPFLVMDYAPHGTLRQLHPRGSKLLTATIVSYVTQVANALQYAHDARVIHLEVKPKTLLLGRNYTMVLSDFESPSVHTVPTVHLPLASATAPGPQRTWPRNSSRADPRGRVLSTHWALSPTNGSAGAGLLTALTGESPSSTFILLPRRCRKRSQPSQQRSSRWSCEPWQRARRSVSPACWISRKR